MSNADLLVSEKSSYLVKGGFLTLLSIFLDQVQLPGKKRELPQSLSGFTTSYCTSMKCGSLRRMDFLKMVKINATEAKISRFLVNSAEGWINSLGGPRAKMSHGPPERLRNQPMFPLCFCPRFAVCPLVCENKIKNKFVEKCTL